jgi:hypothetical protein
MAVFLIEISEVAMRTLARLAVAKAFIGAALTSVAAHAADFSFYGDGMGTSVQAVMLGGIEMGDDVKFKEMVRTIVQQGQWIERIYLFSTGGKMPAALSIGEQIYTLRINTYAPLDYRNPGQPRHFICQAGAVNWHYFPDSKSGDARCNCASACFFIWAAGRGRNGNALGIHRIRFDEETCGRLSSTDAKGLYEFHSNYSPLCDGLIRV